MERNLHTLTLKPAVRHVGGTPASILCGRVFDGQAPVDHLEHAGFDSACQAARFFQGPTQLAYQLQQVKTKSLDGVGGCTRKSQESVEVTGVVSGSSI